MADVQIAIIDEQATEITLAVPGVQGPAGPGVPSGGAQNQLLVKQSGVNYDTAWSDNVDVPGTLDVTGDATFDQDVTVQGDLTVNGTTVTIDAQTLVVEDKNIELGNVATPTDVTADGGGITLKGTTDKTINWVDATDAWTSSENVDLASGKSYRINGTEVLSSTTLGSGVTGSSLTSVGTLGSLTVTGSATAGSFIPTSGAAPSNGLYLPAANTVALSTNGTGKLFIDASGNVGVGKAIPAVLLHLESTSPAIRFTDSDAAGTPDCQISGAGGDLLLEADRDNEKSDSLIRFAIDGSERLRITSAGLVGIGTSSPDGELDVTGTGDANGGVLVVNDAGAIGVEVVSPQPTILLNETDTTDENYQVRLDSGDLLIQTQTDARTGASTKVTIDSSGRVGIGTTSPQQLGHIRTTSASGSNAYLRVTAGDANTGIDFGAEQNGNGIINLRDNADLRVFTNGSEALRVDASRRLLVGTSTSSGTAKLLVQGPWNGGGGAAIAGVAYAGSAAPGINTALAEYNYLSNTHLPVSKIVAKVDAAGWTEGVSHPTRLEFSTTADGASSPTERMRISQNGNIGFGASGYNLGGGNTVSINPSEGLIGFGMDGRNTLVTGTAGCYIFSGGPAGGDFEAGDLILQSRSNVDRRIILATGSAPSVKLQLLGTTGELNHFSTSSTSAVFSTSQVGVSNKILSGRSGGSGITSLGTEVFIVRTDGDVENTNNSYGAISDIKLKENVVDASSQWDDIKALRPVNYNFKEETGYGIHTQIGLIAQEVELVSPGLVSESPDRDEDGNDLGTVTKSVNYSVLYMKAVKALQEAMERIETLEAKVAALESA